MVNGSLKPASHRARRRDRWLALLCAAVILSLVPLARLVRDAVSQSVGREAFLVLLAAVAAPALVFAVRAMRRRGAPAARYFWLAAILTVFAGYAWGLRSSPEEALHFVLYGALGALLFRALAHDMADSAVYAAALALGTLIGVVDETLQWLHPHRVWDTRDIALNAVAVGLMQLVIALALRPAGIRARPGAAGIRFACLCAALLTALLTVSALNTPARIGAYAGLMPGFGYLREMSNHMVEYGHLYRDPDVGTFRSRFGPAVLGRIDAERGAEAGAVLDRYPDRESMAEFNPRYPLATDPFLHEARIHLYRRDRYVEKAREEAAGDPVLRRRMMTVAWRENRLLEKYFGNTLRASSHLWTPAMRPAVRREADPGAAYDSAVSRHLVTSLTEKQLAGVLAAATVLLLLVAWAISRSRDPA